MARTTRLRRLRGLTLIETMVATMIITVAMIGSLGIFMSAQNMAGETSDNSVAESLVRGAVEAARSQGFYWCTTPGSTPCDGSTTAYYDASGNSTTAASAKFTVVTTVASSSLTSGVPDNTALRTITVKVTRKSSGAVLETSGSYLAWGGV